MKKAFLIINGISGMMKLSQQTYKIVESLALKGYSVTVYPVDPNKNLNFDNIDAYNLSSYDLIVCGGGDGTLNSVISEMMKLDKKPVLGYIPAGSTNDFAKSIKLSSDIERACRIITNGSVFPYDIGKFNDKYFNYVAAFGAFSATSYSTEQHFKNAFGHAAYVLNGISQFQQNMNFKCHMKIVADTFEDEGDYIFGAIYNAATVGGISFADEKDIELDDGLFEVLLIKVPDNMMNIGQILGSITNRTYDDDPYTLYKKISRATIYCNDDAVWSLDGEYGGSHKVIDFSVKHKAIKIMVPKKRKLLLKNRHKLPTAQ